jgi:hypothetical protein
MPYRNCFNWRDCCRIFLALRQIQRIWITILLSKQTFWKHARIKVPLDEALEAFAIVVWSLALVLFLVALALPCPPWKLSVEALNAQARLGVGQRPTRRLRERSRDPPLKKQLVKQGWAQTYSTSSTPPTEGLISRSCIWYNKDQVKVYLQTHLLMQGFIFKKDFRKPIFITQVTQLF